MEDVSGVREAGAQQGAGFTAPPPPRGRLGLALGGGAAKGWAHVGVVRALRAIGWEPAVIAGTSMGAAVGAAIAAGQLDALEEWARGLRWRDVLGYLDFGFGGGLIRARRLLQDFMGLLPEARIEGLAMPFGAVATELATGREVWLTEGDVMQAVRASIAIPGMLTPGRVGGRWMVDGGLANPVPVSLCRALGADFVVAVDLQTTLLSRRLLDSDHRAAPGPDGGDDAGGPREGTRVWHRWRRRADELAREDAPAASTPSIYEVVANSINIMQVRIGESRMAADPPDLLVTPRLADYGLLDFHQAARAIEEGVQATRAALFVWGEERRRAEAVDRVLTAPGG